MLPLFLTCIQDISAVTIDIGAARHMPVDTGAPVDICVCRGVGIHSCVCFSALLMLVLLLAMALISLHVQTARIVGKKNVGPCFSHLQGLDPLRSETGMICAQ